MITPAIRRALDAAAAADRPFTLDEARLEIEALIADLIPRERCGTWTFDFDNAATRGGVAKFTSRTITMSRKLVPIWTRAQVINTALHEIAHVLAGRENGHGPIWREIAISIGCDGERTHDHETTPAPWHGACGCKTTWRRHRLTARMAGARCASCRERIEWTDTRVDVAWV